MVGLNKKPIILDLETDGHSEDPTLIEIAFALPNTKIHLHHIIYDNTSRPSQNSVYVISKDAGRDPLLKSYVQANGIQLSKVKSSIQQILYKYQIIGYNIGYDLGVLDKNHFDVDEAKQYKLDLMNVCHRHGIYGGFEKTYRTLFNKPTYIEAHRAHHDAKEEAELYTYLRKQGWI